MQLSSTIHLSNFIIIPDWSSVSIRQWFPFPPSPSPGNHHTTFCFYEFDYSRYIIQVESYHLCPFVPDISFSLKFSWFTHVIVCIRISFLFKNLYICLCAYIYVYITFCFPFVNGDSGYFHLLSTVNNVFMNMGVQISFWVSAFNSLVYIHRRELLNHMVIPCLIFWGVTIFFSTMATPFYTLTAMYRGSNFSTLLPTLFIMQFCLDYPIT